MADTPSPRSFADLLNAYSWNLTLGEGSATHDEDVDAARAAVVAKYETAGRRIHNIQQASDDWERLFRCEHKEVDELKQRHARLRAEVEGARQMTVMPTGIASLSKADMLLDKILTKLSKALEEA